MRKYKRLTAEQRYGIQICLRFGLKQTEIAQLIGVNKSTISREIKRNATETGKYNSHYAQRQANLREIKKHHTTIKARTWQKVIDKLLIRWSPEQISNVLRADGIQICTESIYKFIRADKKHGGTLYKYCRFAMKHRKRTITNAGAKLIPNRRDISERPSLHEPPYFGNFEMDLIIGAKQKGAILTLVERTTQYTIAVKLPHGRDAREVAKAVVKSLDVFKGHILSITTDNGAEFADHAYISRYLHCPVYFAQPYKSWQKGGVEKANQLLRQYLPKKSPLDSISDEYLQSVMYELNSRPRKKLNYESPKKICLEIINTYFCLK